jgi:malonate decarboxylase beta subunit
MSHQQDISRLLQGRSFIELSARERAHSLLDAGSCRELAGPFERLYSPWLRAQGIVAQADDGVIICKGLLDGQPAVVAAIEGGFQGGSLGEVGGAKLACALELAAADNRLGIPTRAAILFETGGVRLQEANLGLAAIAEIHAAIVDLSRYQPVIGIIAGTVGCFGGMSIAAGMCSYLIVTREARLGLNGPQVIEQEAGVAEYDSRNRPFVWGLSGGEQRHACGLADALLEDDSTAIRQQLLHYFASGLPGRPRHRRSQHYLQRLLAIDSAAQADAGSARQLFQQGASL